MLTTWAFAICDVFTDRPLAGNQLAVFPDAAVIPESLLQPLAREINFSETVFVYPPTADGDARLRIFTPTSEVRFAGHPVLGTAVLLGADRGLDRVTLETGVGPVPVELTSAGSGPRFGRMTQPVPTIAPFPNEAGLLAALGVAGSILPVELYDNGLQHVYVALESEEAVARLAPDFNALARVAREEGLALVGTNCFAGDDVRWTTRMFAPADGVPEDPATGSAAGPLACHLARHGRIPWGQEIEISQGAAVGRPSTLVARADGSASGIERVEVGGGAVIVARGAFDAAVLAPS
ncbi:MAG: PhzF family phenazine biosynthesis protein [Chloroflexota bacterium]|nr:PhzF family phenazine biosynthesis protein [Chloroflexota bacterium]